MLFLQKGPSVKHNYYICLLSPTSYLSICANLETSNHVVYDYSANSLSNRQTMGAIQGNSGPCAPVRQVRRPMCYVQVHHTVRG